MTEPATRSRGSRCARAPALAASDAAGPGRLLGDDLDRVAGRRLDVDLAVDVADLDAAARLELVGLAPFGRLLGLEVGRGDVAAGRGGDEQRQAQARRERRVWHLVASPVAIRLVPGRFLHGSGHTPAGRIQLLRPLSRRSRRAANGSAAGAEHARSCERRSPPTTTLSASASCLTASIASAATRTSRASRGASRARQAKKEYAPRGQPPIAPKTFSMPGFREVVRCARCGNELTVATAWSADGSVHAVRRGLSTAARSARTSTPARAFECPKPIPARVSPKDARNTCPFFEPRTTVERETKSAVAPAERRARARPSTISSSSAAANVPSELAPWRLFLFAASWPLAHRVPHPPPPIDAAPSAPVCSATWSSAEYPHDPQAFTQGLVYRRRRALRGHRAERPVRHPQGGARDRRSAADRGSWTRSTSAKASRSSATGSSSSPGRRASGSSTTARRSARKRTFTYTGEGWGLTHDGERLIMSDGTADPALPRSRRRSRRPAGCTVTRRRAAGGAAQRAGVRQGGDLRQRLADRSDRPHRPEDRRGHRLDRSRGACWTRSEATGVDVLNGIAYDAAGDRLFVTGKLWPKLFEIKVRP